MLQELVNNNKELLELNKNEDDKNQEIEDDFLELPLGEALSLKDTYSITSKDKSELVILAGLPECGKTTLITTIYQLFHKGPLDELYFSGSQTIKAFEQRSHFTRINSGMNDPNTTRTQIGTLDSFLHIRLWNNINKTKHTLLLADISGEDFRSARANVEVMKEDFSIIRKADFLVIIIDGDSITQKEKRYSAIQITKELLRTVNNACILEDNTKICFAISKYDLLTTRLKDDPSLHTFVNSIEDKFKNLCNDMKIKNEVQFYNIAAMPRYTDNIAIGYGIKELVRYWIKDDGIDNGIMYLNQEELKSEFNRLHNKVLGGQIYE